MSNGNTNADTNGVNFWSDSSGNLNFELCNASGKDRPAAYALTLSSWTYVVGTWDGSTVKFYTHGITRSSVAQTRDATPTSPLRLGVDGAQSGAGQFFNGILDEVRVSSIARSAD